jgi:prepilin-type N-terminal cleavage/methylation domain-containing protein
MIPKRQGFTLIELLVVISIVALLSSVVLSSLNSARAKAKLSAGKQFSANLYHAAGDQAIGIWDFDECSGSAASDVASGHSLGLTGSPTWSSDSPKGTGCSLAFNGTTNYGTLVTTAFDKVNGGEIAVSAWIKPSRLGGQYQGIASNRGTGGTPYNWIFYMHTTDGAVSFHGSAQYKSSYIPPLNTWTHVAAVVDSAGNSKLYANGSLVQSVSGYTFGTVAGRLSVGATSPGSELFQGSIDEVRIYSKTLTAMEVQDIYAEGLRTHSLAANDSHEI